MIRYRFLDGTEVFIEVDRPDQKGDIQFVEGLITAEIRGYLAEAYGAFGHSLGTYAMPIDLNAAMVKDKRIKRFRPELVEGAELINYTPPKGVKT